MLKRSAKKKIPSVFECRTKLRASWQRRGLQGYTFLVLLRLRLSRALRRLWSRHYDVLHNRKRASQSERCYVEQEKLPSPAPICSSKMDCVPCRSKHLLDRVAREKSQVCSVEDAAWLILKAVEENLRKNARMAKIWNARYKHAPGREEWSNPAQQRPWIAQMLEDIRAEDAIEVPSREVEFHRFHVAAEDAIKPFGCLLRYRWHVLDTNSFLDSVFSLCILRG